jgi:ATP-dependent exoDNAse (exonuclease V) alpha subunit
VDENINKNSLYVAITRAKYDIKIFVDDKEKFLGRAIRSGDKETAHEIVIHTNDSKEKRGFALPKKEFPLPEKLI